MSRRPYAPLFIQSTCSQAARSACLSAVTCRARRKALPAEAVLLSGLRPNAQNPNGFVVVGDALFAEPYAIKLRKDDTPFKTLVDRETVRMSHEGEPSKLCDKRFNSLIPPRFMADKVGNGYVVPRMGFPSRLIQARRESTRRRCGTFLHKGWIYFESRLEGRVEVSF